MRAFWLGLLLWAVMFAVASALYPWSITERHLFESVIAVVLAGVTTCVATAYLRVLQGHILGRAVVTALMWPALCVVLDFVVLMLTPPRLSVWDYLETVGLSYLMIPVIVLGLTYQRMRCERPGQQQQA